MIDRNDFDSPSGPSAGEPGQPARCPELSATGKDLYTDLFASPRQPVLPGLGESADEPPCSQNPPAPHPHPAAPAIAAPTCPATFEEAGIGLMPLADLLLKHLYLQGNTLGVQLARNVRLPFQLVEEALRFLKSEKCLEVISGDLIGPASYRFNLTELGRGGRRNVFSIAGMWAPLR